MADSNPFAHLGQGMLGADVGIARAAATPQPIFEKNPLRGLIGMGLRRFIPEIFGKMMLANEIAN